MKQELVRLAQWGCDVEGSLPRFVDDEDFLLECVTEVAQEIVSRKVRKKGLLMLVKQQ